MDRRRRRWTNAKPGHEITTELRRLPFRSWHKVRKRPWPAMAGLNGARTARRNQFGSAGDWIVVKISRKTSFPSLSEIFSLTLLMDQPRFRTFAIAFVVAALSGSAALAADRVALVIGCGKYRADGIPELSTPVNDARRITATLRAAPLNFDVVEVLEATRNGFFEGLSTFKIRARGARVVLVYYSGHGIEFEGVNYCIPVDAILEKPSHLDSEAVDLGKILSTMQATGAEAKVAVLDSCRNNPFGQTKSWRDTSGKSVSTGLLAALGDAQLPEATLVCFATSPGRKAAAILNDDSQNSPFTEMLLRHLASPGQRLRDIFETTADEVARATENRQLPYVKYDGAASVLRQLVLVPLPPAVSGSPAAATKEVPFGNSLGMKFVPSGTPGVLFGVWDTRVKDFSAFVQESGYDMSKGEKAYTLESDGKDGANWKQTDGDWRNPRFPQPQGEDHPVVCVSWEDAQAFCAWLTKRDRAAGLLTAAQSYRLPGDHEWSVAVGIGSRESATASPESKDNKIEGVYPWGSSWPPPQGAGNFAGEESKVGVTAKAKNWPVIAGYQDGFARTSPVFSFAANAYGLYDMGGNVMQWCEDWYNPAKKDYRVLRGGSWYDSTEVSLRSSYRNNDHPTSRDDLSGFRCVLVVSGG